MSVQDLKNKFDKIRNGEEDKLLEVIKNFCLTFLKDDRGRAVKLTPMQESMVLTSLKHQSVAIVAPRGSGKSFALAVTITIWMYFYRSGEEVFVLAPFIDQTKKIFSYVLSFFESTAELRKMIRHIRFDNSPILRLEDGSVLKPRAVSRTNKGKSVRGQHATFLVIDESSLIEDDIFVSNVEPMVTRHHAPFINIGTPFSKNNHFYRYLYNEEFNDFRRLFFSYKDGMIKGGAYEAAYSEEFIEKKKKQWALNPEAFDIEFGCKFLEESGRFIIYDSVKDKIFERYGFDRSSGGENFISVDFGRMKNSTVISCFEKLVDADVTKIKLKDIEEIIPEKDGLAFPIQRQRIISMAKSYNCKKIIIDATGMGLGQLDELKRELSGDDIKIIPFKFKSVGEDTKTKNYIDFREYLQQGRVIFPHPEHLIKIGQLKSARLIEKGLDQLFDLRYEIRNSNLVIVLLPHHQDDFADCFMMAAVKILPQPQVEGHVTGYIQKMFPSRRIEFNEKFKYWKGERVDV